MIAPSRSELRVFDASLEREVARRSLPRAERVHLLFTQGAAQLVARLEPGGLRLFHLAAPPVRSVLSGHESYVYDVAFSPDGDRLASVSWDRSIRLWRARDGASLAVFSDVSPHELSRVAWSPDGRQIHVASRDRVLSLDASTGQRVSHGEESGVSTSLQSHPSGRLVAVGTETGIRILDAETLGDARALAGEGAVAWSPDGKLLATMVASEAGTSVVVRGPASWSESWRTEIDGAVTNRSGLEWSPDGARLAAHRSDVVSVLSAADGSLLSQVDSTQALLRCVWSPDARRLVTGDVAGAITFWDAATGEQVVTFAGHRAYVMGLAFSPDGSVLASASGDGDVRLWRAERWAESDPQG